MDIRLKLSPLALAIGGALTVVVGVPNAVAEEQAKVDDEG